MYAVVTADSFIVFDDEASATAFAASVKRDPHDRRTKGVHGNELTIVQIAANAQHTLPLTDAATAGTCVHEGLPTFGSVLHLLRRSRPAASVFVAGRSRE